MKDKLITLFKQCCDNPSFNKKLPYSEFEYNGLNLDKPSDFKLSDEVLDILSKCRLKLSSVNERIFSLRGGRYTSANARKFEFNSEPPLYLSPAYVTIKVKFDESCVAFGDVFEETSHSFTTEHYQDKNFWGKMIDKVRNVPVKYMRRNVTVNTEAAKNIAKLTEYKSNIKGVIFSEFSDGFKFLKQNQFMGLSSMCDKTTINGSNADILKEGLKWGNVYRMGVSNPDFRNDSHMMEYITQQECRVNGGVLKFGNVWCWLNHVEYLELETYYLDSIKKTHELVLEQRILETKINKHE